MTTIWSAQRIEKRKQVLDNLVPLGADFERLLETRIQDGSPHINNKVEFSRFLEGLESEGLAGLAALTAIGSYHAIGMEMVGVPMEQSEELNRLNNAVETLVEYIAFARAARLHTTKEEGGSQ